MRIGSCHHGTFFYTIRYWGNIIFPLAMLAFTRIHLIVPYLCRPTNVFWKPPYLVLCAMAIGTLCLFVSSTLPKSQKLTPVQAEHTSKIVDEIYTSRADVQIPSPVTPDFSTPKRLDQPALKKKTRKDIPETSPKPEPLPIAKRLLPTQQPPEPLSSPSKSEFPPLTEMEPEETLQRLEPLPVAKGLLPTPQAPEPLSPQAEGTASPPVAPVLPSSPEMGSEETPQGAESSELDETERPKSEKPIDSLLLQRGAILLPQGYLQVQPSIDYTRFSSSRVAISGLTVFEAIIIGAIQVDRVDREILTSALNLRYGLLPRLQIETRIPFIYRRDSETLSIGSSNETERNTSTHALGDVEGTLVYQALLERGMIPNLLLRVRGKLSTGKDAFEISSENVGGQVRLKQPPTGSGFYTVAPGFTAVWRSDPLVLFTGANYSFNIERDVAGRGTVNPGDSFDFSLGLNLTVNERIGLNISFFDSFTFKTTENGRKVNGTSFNDGRLTFGASISVNPTTTILLSAAAGLTRESPDFTVNLSVPFTMNMLK